MNRKDAAQKVLGLLAVEPDLLAREIANKLGLERKAVNSLLYTELKNKVQQNEQFRWRLSLRKPNNNQTVPPTTTVNPTIQEPVMMESENELELDLEPAVEESDQSTQQNTSFSFESLEGVRRKLLDLSGRNQLLNYKFPRASCVRIIDELPDQIYKEMTDGKAFYFKPVDEPRERELIDAGYIVIDPETKKVVKQEYPTAVQWAKYKNFEVNYDLPPMETAEEGKGHHQDTDLQTVMFAPEMESRLRSIRGKAETALDEAGANILYLVLGFLEWYESNESEIPRYAPLFTIPVQLKRGKLDSRAGTFVYSIEQKDDGYLTNVTLREKLANDFDLLLPEINEDTTPEGYFALVHSTILVHKPRWKVRRQATLALLDFAKQVMYSDLNPENWPKGNNISDHPIVKQFFSRSENTVGAGASNYESEYPIDTLQHAHDHYPLIFEADSSQHSALVDAVRGENLVIEGPPGTGKSQTITNLIAAAIANGKRVLFVAEKMAALEVVKSRLEKAGLGDFCLELHSHKTNKAQVIGDLFNRLTKQDSFRPARTIETEIARYEDQKSKLSRYVALINKSWKETGLTLHQIFTGAVRYRSELLEALGQSQFTEALEISGLSGTTLTPVRQKELEDNTKMLADIYHQTAEQAQDGYIANHFWYGVNDYELTGHQCQSLSQKLEHWSTSLEKLGKQWTQMLTEFSIDEEQDPSLEYIAALCVTTKDLPVLNGKESLSLLPLIRDNLDEFKKYISEYKFIHASFKRLSTSFKPDVLTSAQAQQNLLVKLEEFVALGLNDQCNLIELVEVLNKTKSGLDNLKGLVGLYEQIKTALPAKLHPCLILSAQGLKEFTTLIALIKQLPSELWAQRNDIYDNPDLDPLISSINVHLTRMMPLQKQLIDQFHLHRLPDAQDLRRHQGVLENTGFFSFLSSEWRSSKKAIFAIAANPKPKKKDLFALVPRLLEYRNELDAIEKINNDNSSLGELYKGVDTPIAKIGALRKWYKAVRTEYGIGFGDRVELGSALLSLDRNLANKLADKTLSEHVDHANEILALLTTLADRFPNVTSLKKPSIDLMSKESPLRWIALLLRSGLTELKPLIAGTSKPVVTLLADAEHLKTVSARCFSWKDSLFAKQNVKYALSIVPDEYSAETVSAHEACAQVAEQLQDYPALIKCVSNIGRVDRYVELQQCAAQILKTLEETNIHQKAFAEAGKVNLKDWSEACEGRVFKLIKRNEGAVANPLWLITWCDYIRVKTKLSKEGLGAIINNLEEKQFPVSHLSIVLNYVVYEQLAKEALAEDESLALFSGLEQLAIRNRFREYDKKLLELQREHIAYRASQVDIPIGNASGRASEYTGASLIRREAGKKTKHVPVRQLLKRATTTIKNIKPCFMMSPMSVAQYLEPGYFDFDMVVMDEASQIRPEDALGAVARGNSLIVVGDPKQLPPTSFFHKAISNDDNNDLMAAEEAESILETVMPMFRNRRLRWHYRSRHESLIAFSNKHFYDENLVIFPSPFQKTQDLGVFFHRVIKGRFVNRRNTEEAKIIVEKVSDLLLSNQSNSVGVVAMSAEQKDEIEKQLEQYVKDHPLMAEALERNLQSDEPIFVKNLENVQGDERDTILISMTYGPEQLGGRTFQRFGPINSSGGGRRLNVLFTRAKKQMHIFSSMASSDVIVSNSSSIGVKALRAFLEYCENRHLHNVEITHKIPDSDFEISVIRELEKRGYGCEPQVGTAGYFLDIAVRDPGNPGRYLLGIECDGATYHSAKSTRDRDRLRQDILEDLGWKIHRIWSTDWFKNPEAQLEPILRELEELRTISQMFPDEAVELESIKVEEVIANFESIVEENINENITLKSRLEKFNNEIIIKNLPETPDGERLLRPSMLEALLNHLPCSKAEFVEVIPPYIRLATNKDEGKYLDDVLEIIANYS